jgi:hypothetical protein
MEGFDILLINECLQHIPLFGRTFDVNDLLFSAIGMLTSDIVFDKSHSFSAIALHKSTVLTGSNI